MFPSRISRSPSPGVRKRWNSSRPPASKAYLILDRFKLDDKVAFVTGAAQGIGNAIARALCEAGAKVIVSDVDEAACEAAAEALRRDGFDAHAMVLDVADVAAIETAAHRAVEIHDRVDILVNNAGVASLSAALDLADAEWRRVMDVNADAVFRISRAFGRHMIERRAGAVVNVGSMSGIIVNKGFSSPHYMVSKAAAHQITRALAVEWAPFGVRVNAVAPGYTATSQNEALRGDPALARAAIDNTPMARFAEPVEIAAAVLFLASPAASYCTGTILTVDGGHTCW